MLLSAVMWFAEKSPNWSPFNIYLSDMPYTRSLKSGCSDDRALMHQGNALRDVEIVLADDLAKHSGFFKR